MDIIKNTLIVFCAVVPLGLLGGVLLAVYDELKEKHDIKKRKLAKERIDCDD
jgi:hypothetical protein